MSKIRVMIVDDHEMVRMGMRTVFELEPDLTVVGEASNGAEAIAKVGLLDPQVIFMDVRMEKLGGIEACREIKSLKPDIQILMITSYTDEDAVPASILAGASGYLLKNANRVELLKALRAVSRGEAYLDQRARNQAVQRLNALASADVTGAASDLTGREREVLALVARGYTNKQIAAAISVSEKTARNHVSHILEKLGLTRRSEAAAFAVEHRLVPPRDRSRPQDR